MNTRGRRIAAFALSTCHKAVGLLEQRFVLVKPSSFSATTRTHCSCFSLPTTTALQQQNRGLSMMSTMTTSLDNKKPSRPFAYFQQAPHLDLEELGQQIIDSEERRNEAFEVSRKLQIAHVQAKTMLETSSSVDESSLKESSSLRELFQSSFPEKASRDVREANLSYRVQEHVQHEAFLHFLETFRLLSPSACPYATDEEYLAGACMGLASDLARYGLGRAIERDLDSIALARDLVEAILEYLLQFDFRNGPLRRKYDGTKYALQSLETLLYELSVTTNSNDTPVTKKAKTDTSNDNSLMPQDELEELRIRMQTYDELRETLIKNCRDGQKAAKQSIFALHRKNVPQANKLLNQCEDVIANQLLPTVQQEPSLRSGSFSNVVEEYVEAKLFYAWLHGKEETDDATTSPSGILLSPQEFSIMKMEPEEYLGGLCDLSGEVGRFAVQRGTVRDVKGIQLCLETNASILVGLQTLPRLPSGIGKKMDQVRRSVEKLERMLYLQTLSEATGGRNVVLPSSGGTGDAEQQ